MGSFFSVMTKAQSAAYLSKKIFMTRGLWKVYGDERCDEAKDSLIYPPLKDVLSRNDDVLCCTTSCVFLRFTNCTIDDVLVAFNEEFNAQTSSILEKLEDIETFTKKHNINTNMDTSRVHFGFGLAYNKQLESDHFDFFDDFTPERLVMHQFLNRPQRWVRQEIYQRTRQAFSMPTTPQLHFPNYVSIHIRHGDRVEHPHIATETYMKFAMDYISANKITNIFIATDDEEAIEQLRTAYPAYKYSFNSY